MSRSKSGCITCRIRRVKCDEAKPHCQRCRASKRTCDGYLTPENAMSRRELAEAVKAISSTGQVARALAQVPSSGNPRARRVVPGDAAFFDLFRRGTIAGTNDTLPTDFWQRDVMQLAHSEPALWHATVALGKLHAKVDAETREGRIAAEAMGRQAVKHYIQAMALARDLDALPKYVILSVVLSAIASMLGRWGDMQTHVLSGLRMLVTDGAEVDSVRMLGAAVLRMDLQAMTAYMDPTQPYPFHTSRALFDVEMFLQTRIVHGLTIEKLSSDLFAIGRAFFLLDDGLLAGYVPQGPWLTKIEGLLRRLATLEGRLAAMEFWHRPSASEEQAMLSLRLFHVTMRMLAAAGPRGPASRFDRFLGHWEYAVRLAASIQARMKRKTSSRGVSLEPGMIVALQQITHHCRHHSLRHAALRILADANRVESMWRSDTTYYVQNAIVAVEEESIGTVSAPVYEPALLDGPSSFVPWSDWAQEGFSPATTLHWRDQPVITEEMRVAQILATTHPDKRCVDLSLIMASGDEAEPEERVRKLRVTY